MAKSSNVPQLGDNECFDEVWGAKVRFSNPSEALLAQLFLKEDGAIPLPALDALLSVIRNPSFNVKDVNFNNCGDFCSIVTSSRVEATTRRGWESETGIPEVILEGALDVLGAELLSVWDDAREHYHGNMIMEFGYYDGSSLQDVLTTWRDAIFNCALVHSSWLVRARPLLGYYHRFQATNLSPLSRSLTNPCLGPWTRDLQIKFEERSPLPHDVVINAFFTRLPNLRTFCLQTLHYVSRPYDGFIAGLCKSLSFLTSLEEIYFSSAVSEEPNLFVQQLSKTPPSSLKSVQFLSGSLNESAPHNLPLWLLPLLSIASLQSFRVHGNGMEFIKSVLWSRSPGKPGIFGLEELDIRATEATTNVEGRMADALRAAKRLSLKYRGGQATVGRVVSKCRSLRSLSLIGDRRESEFFDLAEIIPSTIEELSISFPPLADPGDNIEPEDEYNFPNLHFMNSFRETTAAKGDLSMLNVLDKYVYKVLHSEKTGRLQDIKIHIHPNSVSRNQDFFHSPNHRLLYRRNGDDPLSGAPVLPLCQNICLERGISFSVEMQLLKSDFDE
ncbi:hypothetical protein SCHPADRAFT_900230 [Schizopora paradoxa]|uniref:Uncharacterized protein n=1 Tax=Schizopora paradoxa TaxID=27342 RepID=A0A0H2S0H4_9AGAM|nr:hypothetical protein SCHPADRAFT_900230 [Schizopora paradoxa]